MLLTHPSKSYSLLHSRFLNSTRHLLHHQFQCLPIPRKSTSRWTHHPTLALHITSSNGTDHKQPQKAPEEEKSFWGAVSLIIGTAVGPGMLGLPAATIRSGPLPSTLLILLSWVYVISSIILIAELSFAAMAEDGVEEVSFTGLATKTLGTPFGSFVALVYACLSFSLLVACISGIGAIVLQRFPWMNPVCANALFPLLVGTVIGFFPFEAIDAGNRFLCFIMLFSIIALVLTGFSVARTKLLGSIGRASWNFSSILPAIPVTVLTLGFHVVTPFICRIAGNTVSEARKAILFGGAIPLIMVLSWNLIVLGLAGVNAVPVVDDPISLLLSVNSSALSAVEGFAFSALATSLIGYAVSFPKQLADTLELIFGNMISQQPIQSKSQMAGRVGFVTYLSGHDLGNGGKISYGESRNFASSEGNRTSGMAKFDTVKILVMPLVLGVPVLIASFFRSTFTRALEFAGTYANCFLFGILPPVMTYLKGLNIRSDRTSPGGIFPLANCSGLTKNIRSESCLSSISHSVVMLSSLGSF